MGQVKVCADTMECWAPGQGVRVRTEGYATLSYIQKDSHKSTSLENGVMYLVALVQGLNKRTYEMLPAHG